MNSRSTSPAHQSGPTTKGILTRLGVATGLSVLPSAAIALTTDGFIHMMNDEDNQQDVNNDWHAWLAFGASMTVTTLALFSLLYKCAARTPSRPSNGYSPVSTEDTDVEASLSAPDEEPWVEIAVSATVPAPASTASAALPIPKSRASLPSTLPLIGESPAWARREEDRGKLDRITVPENSGFNYSP